MNPFGDLQKLRDKPIPPPVIKRGYRSLPIDRDGAANKQPLVPVADHGVRGRNIYADPRTPPYYHIIPGAIEALVVREGVARKLAAVNARLAATELELFLFDGWRPQDVQRYFHDTWLPAELQKRRPELRDEALTAEVETYWAAPSAGEGAPSPHSTGGAVDLTVRWRGGDPLWMGSLFDDAAAISKTAHFESVTEFSFSAEEARANRRLLYWVMTEAGFASNPSEWWHFSYGDQMWAQLTEAPAALYGGADFPA